MLDGWHPASYNLLMPIVKIGMWAGRDKELKKELIEKITAAVCTTLKCPPEKVIIVIEDIPKENWGEAGQPAG